MDSQAQRETKATREIRATLEHKVRRVTLDRRAPSVLLGHKVHRDQRVIRVTKAIRVQ
jgi:hypothetical protein